MAKVSGKQILDGIKRAEQSKPSKKNYTFRLSEKLMGEFQDFCDKKEVAQGKVVEELIANFIKSVE